VFTLEVVVDDGACAGCEILDCESDELGEVRWAVTRDVAVDVLVEQLCRVELGGVWGQQENLRFQAVYAPRRPRAPMVAETVRSRISALLSGTSSGGGGVFVGQLYCGRLAKRQPFGYDPAHGYSTSFSRVYGWGHGFETLSGPPKSMAYAGEKYRRGGGRLLPLTLAIDANGGRNARYG
jgi:hypothetical protein